MIYGHEVWECLPDRILLQGIIFVCKLCYDTMHFEQLRERRPGPSYLKAVEDHYCKINSVTLEDLKRDYKTMRRMNNEILEKYKRVRPKTDYGRYEAEAQAERAAKMSLRNRLLLRQK